MSNVSKLSLAQATFPVLGANIADDGRYGLAYVNGGAGVKPFVVDTHSLMPVQSRSVGRS